MQTTSGKQIGRYPKFRGNLAPQYHNSSFGVPRIFMINFKFFERSRPRVL